MTLVPGGLPVTAMLSALASSSRAPTDATPASKTNSARPVVSPNSPMDSPERIGLAIGGTTAQALHE